MPSTFVSSATQGTVRHFAFLSAVDACGGDGHLYRSSTQFDVRQHGLIQYTGADNDGAFYTWCVIQCDAVQAGILQVSLDPSVLQGNHCACHPAAYPDGHSSMSIAPN